MIKQLKKLTIQMIAGANIATVLIMLAAGFSYRLHPLDHPYLACAGMIFPVFLLINLAFLFFWIVFKWNKMWIPIGGYLLAYVPISIYIPLNLPREAPPDAVKLISYNVEQYTGDPRYKDAFEQILGYLKDEQPDIVCLQEDCDTWRRTMQFYEKVFPYNDTIRINRSKSKTFNGVGIHTRFPILRRERIEYESLANGSVAYFLDIGNGDTLIVINNHLESNHLSVNDRKLYKEMLKGEMGRDTARIESKRLLTKLAENAQIRARQADAVHRYIEAHSHYPMLVCGDFNDTPLSYARYRIAQGLTDCFAAAGRGAGLSYNRKGFNFRIDHIFCSPDIKPYNCKIDNEIDFSDHYPAICWLKIAHKP